MCGGKKRGLLAIMCLSRFSSFFVSFLSPFCILYILYFVFCILYFSKGRFLLHLTRKRRSCILPTLCSPAGYSRGSRLGEEKETNTRAHKRTHNIYKRTLSFNIPH